MTQPQPNQCTPCNDYVTAQKEQAKAQEGDVFKTAEEGVNTGKQRVGPDENYDTKRQHES